MLNKNLKTIRNNKGFTQEELANRLHVTRQTISKWEKGYSVPDADLLSKLADELDVSVSELLGKDEIPAEETDSLSVQLARINEQLSIRNRRAKRVWKAAIVLAIVFFLVIPAVTILGNMMWSSNLDGADTGYAGRVEYTCTLDGEKYIYSIEYNEQYQITAGGGDSFVADHADVENYDDACNAAAAIEDYFRNHGGTAEQTEVKGLELD